jgi:hypothetical protein
MNDTHDSFQTLGRSNDPSTADKEKNKTKCKPRQKKNRGLLIHLGNE